MNQATTGKFGYKYYYVTYILTYDRMGALVTKFLNKFDLVQAHIEVEQKEGFTIPIFNWVEISEQDYYNYSDYCIKKQPEHNKPKSEAMKEAFDKLVKPKLTNTEISNVIDASSRFKLNKPEGDKPI